ncbi:oxaloacetate decarboxylase, gamma chain [Oxobacter pfennigii]|uniref:Oxaloacetate decarboxylase, gamma chain n=1 Tax=Oxobacter pfennigii TaxID=36849 RepID=A0A0P8W2L4_9CLOT|nr:OadG family protein [Oxobacter pfennigii]KPU42745.1 oxaloacetate decarboxylase, gamma chain [Oxobacter pfennigii]
MLEKLEFLVSIILISMTIVSVVLILLSSLIRMQKYFFKSFDYGASEKKNEEKDTNKPALGNTKEDELAAVITSAIAAVLGEPASSIVVKSIRQVQPIPSAWIVSARQEQVSRLR